MSAIDEIRTICVVGAGAMGAQIAQQCALHGYQVNLFDSSRDALARAATSNRGHLQRRVEKGRMTAGELEAALARVDTTKDFEDAVAGADFVIEAVPEELELKREVFEELDRCAAPHAILASNSSAIGVSHLASVTERPEQCVNMHFFNPPLVMELVEVCRGPETNDETVETTMDLVRRIGRTPVLVRKEIAGFLVNRILGAIFHEAQWLVEQGYASAEDVDRAMELGARHPMGPFRLMDFAGLDVSHHMLLHVYEETGDVRFRPSKTLEGHVMAGELGVKTGKGFYAYPREPE